MTAPADPKPRVPVAITGAGVVSAVGFGAPALWGALAEGRDGIRTIERFSTEGFSVHTAGMVPVSGDLASPAEPAKKTADHALDFAIRAAREAVIAAKLRDGEALSVPAVRVAVVFGTSLATHPEGIHRLAELTADAIGARGPRLTISTACSSSANAIGVGRDLLLSREADVVLAGGADALTEEIFAGFHNLGLLTPDKCAPFSDTTGTTLGEGAGFVVLEREDGPPLRGAGDVERLGWVSGYGLSCDAYHATSPDATGAGVARASRGALSDAGLSPDDIDYVNAHGTGTLANDPAEWRGIVAVLGERAAKVPVSATKSVFGHGQGAAGALEMIATLLAMRHGSIPQTLHHRSPRPRCPEDPVAQPVPRRHPVAHALCNSSAFGGANAVVVIDAPAHRAPARAVVPRPVYVRGAGLFLPGIAGDVPGTGTLASMPVPRSAAGLDLRGFDPLSRYLTFATAEALREAGVSLRGALRDRVGLFAALVRISPTSAHELDDSVKERGLLRLSAPAFTRVVLNASTGACARALQLRGPTTTLTTGDGSGLFALAMAASHLSLRADSDALCVAAADEIDRDEAPSRLCEAGACLLLATPDLASPAEPPGSARVRLAGATLAGPFEREVATRRALSEAGIEPGDRPLSELSQEGPLVAAAGAHPLIRAALAVQAVRAGERPFAVVSYENRSAAAAVVFTREPSP
ncbi:MAG: beta-ketoacyl-[acyl-carrier-protein] synthase family protein [Polyangiaceae bacterium]